MNFAAKILKWCGWKVSITVPDYPKCLICVAPHTSNWDFLWGKLAYASVGRHAGFLMKATWFKWPVKGILLKMGGIPVPRKGGGSLTDHIIERYNTEPTLSLAVTPEGTRSRADRWRTGFLRIAMGAKVPLVLAVLDYSQKLIQIEDEYIPTGNIEEDLNAIKQFYKPYKGKHPENFSTDKTDSLSAK